MNIIEGMKPFLDGKQLIYACESGSRAWGFQSKDSDYDIRFIYLQEKKKYISVFDHDETIEKTIGNLDYAGWDFRKSLRLLAKSNPPLLEWLHSPIVYHSVSEIMKEYISLSKVFYNPIAAIYHYYHMARNNYNQYIKNRDELWVKKYFYVLRLILACKYIEQNNYSIVPVKFDDLLYLLPSRELYDDVLNLIQKKMNGEELRWGESVNSISLFLSEEIKRLDANVGKYNFVLEKASVDRLNDFYYRVIREYAQ